MIEASVVQRAESVVYNPTVEYIYTYIYINLQKKGSYAYIMLVKKRYRISIIEMRKFMNDCHV